MKKETLFDKRLKFDRGAIELVELGDLVGSVVIPIQDAKQFIQEFIDEVKENKTFKNKIDYIQNNFRTQKLTSFDIEDFLLDMQHALNSEIDKKAKEKFGELINAPQVTDNSDSVLPRLAKGSQKTEDKEPDSFSLSVKGNSSGSDDDLTLKGGKKQRSIEQEEAEIKHEKEQEEINARENGEDGYN